MEITRIQTVGRDRARLYLDGEEEPRTELALDLVVCHGLAPGDTLTGERLRALVREDEAYRARSAALNLLAHRARSRKEFPEPVIEETLAWLEERGYVDDRAFAESFVRDRLRLRPRGRFALARELGRKGVDREVAEAAIAAVMEAEGVEEAALARDAADAWARKNRSALRKAGRSKEGRLKARRRLYGHLARRGFPPDAVRLAIASVLDDD